MNENIKLRRKFINSLIFLFTSLQCEQGILLNNKLSCSRRAEFRFIVLALLLCNKI